MIMYQVNKVELFMYNFDVEIIIVKYQICILI